MIARIKQLDIAGNVIGLQDNAAVVKAIEAQPVVNDYNEQIEECRSKIQNIVKMQFDSFPFVHTSDLEGKKAAALDWVKLFNKSILEYYGTRITILAIDKAIDYYYKHQYKQ